MLKQLLTITGLSLAFAGTGLAEDVPAVRDTAGPIIVRQTVPYPAADGRRPLTSDQFSTRSSRLIDARRGFRPYRSYQVYDEGRYLSSRVYYRDTFGIIRPDADRLTYRQPATGPTTFTGFSRDTTAQSSPEQRTRVVAQDPPQMMIFDAREQQVDPAKMIDAAEREDVDMIIHIHQGKAEKELKSGSAVLIRSDGTVIEVR